MRWTTSASALIALCAGCTQGATGGPEMPAATTRLVIEESGPATDVSMLHGFNTNMLAGGYRYTDPELIELTRPLHPQWLRFPGGTVANFYDWERQRFDEEALTSSASEKLNVRNERSLAQLEARGDATVSFDDFMAFAGATGARAVVVVNLYSGTPQQSAAWVKYARDKGYQVAYWELGNELYLPHYRNRFPNPEAYLKVARQHAAAMRAADRSARLAVPAHPGAFHKLDASGYGARWNQALARETFYDDYTLHPYLDVREVEGADQASGRFPELATRLFSLSDQLLDGGLEHYRGLFGDRRMWLTEWNLMDHAERRIAGTALHALFVGDYLLRAMGSGEAVALAAYHVLAGAWNGYPAITPGRAERGPSVRRSTYGTLQLVGEALAGATRRVPVTMLGPQASGLVASALVAPERSFLLVSNRNPGPLRVRIERSNGRPVTALRQRAFVAGDLESRALFEDGQLVEADVAGAELTLAPRSFTQIALR
jgi:hypothetical protein